MSQLSNIAQSYKAMSRTNGDISDVMYQINLDTITLAGRLESLRKIATDDLVQEVTRIVIEKLTTTHTEEDKS